MKVTLQETQLGLRNSTTRLPFRYGKACLTRCPQAVLRVCVETANGRGNGYSGDCLPPGWFDKSPDKDFAQQITDMLAVVGLAEQVYLDALQTPAPLFPAWRQAESEIQSTCRTRGLTPLLASFGSSLLERAILDALCRLERISFAQAVRQNLFGMVAGEVIPELAGLEPADWLPPEPRRSLYVRHTVGLADPLTASDIPADERLDDGFPEALEEYVRSGGVRYLKIKVCNQLDHDLERLRQIAEIIERERSSDYFVTLDGNEQYGNAQDFDELVSAIRREPALHTLWRNVLVIEQPLERKIALHEEHTQGIRELSRIKPVIIDESDGGLLTYRQATSLGYRGVSSKNCKGAIKSLLNAGLTWVLNGRGERNEFVMTGEDLCSVGIIPVQADMCLVATLGLSHIERNGHHYHPGLSYLPEEQQAAALRAHPDLYARQQGVVAPRLVDGQFQIGSLQCAGFGFDVEPDMSSMQAADGWEFESLGLPSD